MLIGAAVFVGIALLMALIAFVLLGVAVTVGVLLIVVPVAIGIAILASLFQPRAR